MKQWRRRKSEPGPTETGRFDHAHPTALLTVVALAAPLALRAAPSTVIELTQVACQFLESEQGVDHGYTTSASEDCQAINASTDEARLAKAATLELKPGKYIFRVSNRDVPYELGFWLRGATLLSRATLPSVSGGGLAMGQTRDYEVELKPGQYVYSCPLNPTPDYPLVVK